MSFLAPVIILVLALLQALLQLVPGIFTIFYHSSLGRRSPTKTDNLSLFFILGTETFTVAIWLILYAAISGIFYHNADFNDGILVWLVASVFLALGLASLLFYYRKGPSTALYIPRNTAAQLTKRAESIKTRSDAFVLGFLSSGIELLFSLPIYLVAIVETMKIHSIPRVFIIIPYVIVSISPLFGIRALYRSGHNLATVERLRTKAKPIVRFLLCTCFIVVAILLIETGILNHG